jgi:protein-tyrosine phosphatase
MRESDPEHSPAAFALKYPTVGLVIDISGDSPSYDPKSLKAAGIEYRKVPTVSKVPPPVEKVEEFITVAKEFLERHPDQDICIHCHYVGYWNGLLCSFELLF